MERSDSEPVHERLLVVERQAKHVGQLPLVDGRLQHDGAALPARRVENAAFRLDGRAGEARVDVVQDRVAVGAVHQRDKRRRQRQGRPADVQAEVRRRRGALDVDLIERAGEAPIDSSVPSMPLMVSRSACSNSYEPLIGLADGWSAAQGPNWPVAVTRPVGLGLVSRAVKRTGRSKAASVSTRSWISNVRGGRSGLLDSMASVASVDRSVSITTGDGPCSARWSSDASRLDGRSGGVGGLAGPTLWQEDLEPVDRHRIHVDRLAQDGQHGHGNREVRDAHQRRVVSTRDLVVQHETAADDLHLASEHHVQLGQLDAWRRAARRGSTPAAHAPAAAASGTARRRPASRRPATPARRPRSTSA